jgi:hypothetical protein
MEHENVETDNILIRPRVSVRRGTSGIKSSAINSKLFHLLRSRRVARARDLREAADQGHAQHKYSRPYQRPAHRHAIYLIVQEQADPCCHLTARTHAIDSIIQEQQACQTLLSSENTETC